MTKSDEREWPNGLRALGSRDYRVFWSAALVSSVGSHMQLAALGWVVAVLTDSATKVALVAFGTIIPLVVLSPIAGSLTDRYPRRLLLLSTMTLQTAQATALAITWLAGIREFSLIFLLAIVGGIATAMNGPVLQAFVPELVPRRDLPNAVMLNSAQFNVAKALGPIAAGVLLVNTAGASWCFLLNAISFGAVMIAVASIHEGRHPPPLDRTHGYWRDFVDGTRHVVHEPGLRAAIGINGFVAMVGQPLVPLIPVVALELYDADSVQYGVLAGALGIGAILGAVLTGRLDGRWKPSRILALGLFMYAAFVCFVALSTSLNTGIVAITGAGAGFLVVIATDNSCIQALAKEPWRGRVIGIWLTAYGIAYPVGVLVQGILVDAIGVRTVLLGDAVLLTIGTVVLLVRRTMQALDTEEAIANLNIGPVDPEELS
ncbi:MAG: MFS transporter [Acidimicrobiia bacterium]